MSTLVNPSTGAELDVSPASATLEEADAVIARAHDAFPAWRDVAPGERARLLRAFAGLVDEHLEELAQLEVLNAGHTIGNARWEAGNVRDCLNYYSAAPERLFGRQIPVPGGIAFHAGKAAWARSIAASASSTEARCTSVTGDAVAGLMTPSVSSRVAEAGETSSSAPVLGLTRMLISAFLGTRLTTARSRGPAPSR